MRITDQPNSPTCPELFSPQPQAGGFYNRRSELKKINEMKKRNDSVTYMALRLGLEA